jgi:hypothetical protein
VPDEDDAPDEDPPPPLSSTPPPLLELPEALLPAEPLPLLDAELPPGEGGIVLPHAIHKSGSPRKHRTPTRRGPTGATIAARNGNQR